LIFSIFLGTNCATNNNCAYYWSCEKARMLRSFNLIMVYLAFFFILMKLTFDNAIHSQNRLLLKVLLGVILTKFFWIVSYIIFFEIKINEYKRNEYTQEWSILKHEKYSSEFLGVFHRIFNITKLQNIQLETSFFQKKFPIEFTFIFGALTFFSTFILLILTTFYLCQFSVSAFAIFLNINFLPGLLCGIKSIRGIYISLEINFINLLTKIYQN